MTKVLLIDDDNYFLKNVSTFLERSGMVVIEAKNGQEGLKVLENTDSTIDIMVVDFLMPVIDGIEFCREARKKENCKNTPIIMLTALSDISDKFVAFESGADDYLTKPFESLELLLRIKSLLKRNHPEKKLGINNETDRSPLIKLDKKHASLNILGKVVKLTVSEFSIFEYLFKKIGEPISAEELLENVLGYASVSGDTSTIRFHIKNIRRKIEKDPTKPQILINMQGLGYTISETSF